MLCLGILKSALSELRQCPDSTKLKAECILTSDGKSFEIENLDYGEGLPCEHSKFPDQFSFFLSLSDIKTIQVTREDDVNVKATGRLNRLHVDLLKQNLHFNC